MFVACCETPSDSGKIEAKNGSDWQIACEKRGGRARVPRRKECIYWKIRYVVSEASAKFSISLTQAAVTKDTTILVIGKANTNLFQEDPRSLKMQKVEALQQEGTNIRVIPEQEFLGEVCFQLSKLVTALKSMNNFNFISDCIRKNICG